MNQAELRTLAEERIEDAKVLLDGERWEFAYYVAGYAVECALKSCVLARMIHTGWVFEDKANVKDCLTHDFGKLVELSGLKAELDAQLAASTAAGGEFVGYWGTVSLWRVTTRYAAKSQAEAEALYEAITHDPHGVLKWIRTYWQKTGSTTGTGCWSSSSGPGSMSRPPVG
ncbi:MAG: HEPN domain-containing protein [Gemmataceae bacterium]|nr:HEPN domain-containing protein [Gemmataceae bacterium]